jgi:hypothetical protein
LLPVLFPDGQVPSARWRRFVAGVLVVTGAVTLVAMFKPDSDVEGLGVRNPLWIGPAHVGPAWHLLLLGPVLVLAFAAAPTALIALTARQRRAVGRTRAQLQWLLLGGSASSSPARRSGGGSGETCTTGSAPSWRAWRCSWTAWRRT